MFFITKNKHNFLPTLEDFNFNYTLDLFTKFNIIIPTTTVKCTNIILNFGFKEINFEKKEMIAYFFLLELLSNQKCVLTISRKNFLAFKIKKGAVTGCKVNIRKIFLNFFLNALFLALPRSEVFKGFSLKHNNNSFNNFSTKLQEFYIFYPLEFEIYSKIKPLDLTFQFNFITNLEKIFFFTYHKIPLQLQV